jgi:LysM repeat protein
VGEPTWCRLATINRVYDVNRVSVGQTLILPNPLPAGSVQVLPGIGQTAPSTSTGSTTSPVTSPVYTPPVVVYAPGTTVTTVTTYTSYVVRTGDNLSSIAARFGTTPQAILNANFIANANLVYVGQLLTIPRTSTNVVQPRIVSRPVASGRVYIVQPGDNLFSIGARFGRDAWAIAKRNGIFDLNAIFVGQPLVIP